MTTLAGRYEIIKELDRGGFGITFLARDTMQPSQPQCVVKQLNHNQTTKFTKPTNAEAFKNIINTNNSLT